MPRSLQLKGRECEHLESFLFLDVRLAALEALVDFTRADGRHEDLEYLLDIAESDPDRNVRHKLIRMMVLNPPFDRTHKHRLDREQLVERLWTNIK